MGRRHMHFEQLATGFDAADKPLQGLPCLHLLSKRGDDRIPMLVVQTTGDALIHQNLHVALGL
ncbi:hypothetical protein D3C78_1919830 [compost metagenome]